MTSIKRVVSAYAKALFQNVQLIEKAGLIETFDVGILTLSEDEEGFKPDIYIIGEELLILRSTLTSSASMQEFFSDPTYLEYQKLDILFSIFPGLTIMTRSFLKVMTERGHLSLIPEVSTEYTRLLSLVKKSTKVRVIVANGLEESSGPLLLNTLRKITDSKEIILSAAYCSQLLGGLLIEYKSTSIDATLVKEFGLFFSDI